MRPLPALALDQDGLEAYAVGLEAVTLLAQHFPVFFAEQAGCPVTPTALLGAVAAFFQLVEQRGLPLRWPEDEYGELDHCEAPEDTLVMYDGVSVDFLRELGHYVFQVRPRYYGVGVQLLIEEGYTTAFPLRLTLYQLMRGTPLDIGVDLGMLREEARHLPPMIEATIAEQRPIPADVGPLELFALAGRDIPEAAGLASPGAILSYAFGQTGNPLADTNEVEQSYIAGGEDSEWWGWDDIDRLAAWSREAQRIENAFDRWSRRIIDAGPCGVEEVAALLRRHARTLRRRDARQAKTARTLVQVLGPMEPAHDDDDPLAALAAEPAAAAAA